MYSNNKGSFLSINSENQAKDGIIKPKSINKLFNLPKITIITVIFLMFLYFNLSKNE